MASSIYLSREISNRRFLLDKSTDDVYICDSVFINYSLEKSFANLSQYIHMKVSDVIFISGPIIHNLQFDVKKEVGMNLQLSFFMIIY